LENESLGTNFSETQQLDDFVMESGVLEIFDQIDAI